MICMRNALVILLIALANAFVPFVTEYIVPFDLPTNDLKDVSQNQLSKNDFLTNNFTSNKIKISSLIYQTTYNGSQRNIQPKQFFLQKRQASSYHKITNDSIDVRVTYHATIDNKKITGSTQLKIYLNYTKVKLFSMQMLNEDSGLIQIQNLKQLIDLNSFKMSYSGSLSDTQKKKMNEINTGNTKDVTSIYTLLKNQEFSQKNFVTYFKQNLVQQKLSPTYDSQYFYNFGQTLNITFDMRTAQVEPYPSGIAHNLRAKIRGYSVQPQRNKSLANVDSPGYHTLFTFDFLDYFTAYNVEYNRQWRNFKVNRGTFPASALKFRLVDLQYVFEGLLDKYSQYYLNDVTFVCNPNKIKKWLVDQTSDELFASMVWNCKGQIEVGSSPVIFTELNIQLIYMLTFEIINDSIWVKNDKTYIDSIAFSSQPFKLIDQKLARNYCQQLINQVRGWRVGSGFKVKPKSSSVSLKEDEGLYVK